MITLILLLLPCLAVSFFMAFKVPKKVKDVVFKTKTTTFVTATVVAFAVGHLMLSGVLATYAALFMDIFLTIIFSGIRWAHLRKYPRIVVSPSVKALSLTAVTV